MKKLIILFLITCINLYSYERYELPVNNINIPYKAKLIAKSQIGTTEATNNNDGPRINEYQKSVGIRQGTSKKQGDPYCAAGIYWSYTQAVKELLLSLIDIPIPRTGSSQGAFDYAIKKGRKTSNDPKDNDLIIWRQKTEYKGHVAVIDSSGRKGWIRTVEFNTSSGNSGSQRDGGGVYSRKRNYLAFLGSMYVRGFIGFYKR